MIDTNELRRLAQAAMHPVTKGRWMRLFGERTVYDRMEDGCRGIPVVSTPVSPPHPFEAACLDFIAAANPAAVIEILDRLEAAESECLEQARLNGMGGEREAALMAKLEAAEIERDSAKKLADSLALALNTSNHERDNLRAKIEQMERQEPVAKVESWTNGSYSRNYKLRWLRDVNEGAKLYALPGAQNVPEKLCYDSRCEISIDYVDGWNAAIDAVRGKSPSWYCPDCCIVFPFGEPKSCPHDDARCNRALTAAPEVEGK